MILALICVSLVSAHYVYSSEEYSYKEKIVESKYYPEDNLFYSRTTYIDYDNDKRYSTYDYRHGYSYRTTTDYRDRHYQVKNYYEDDDKGYNKYQKGYNDYYEKDYRRDSKDYYYEYIPYLREYQKKECYHEAPKGKLFYIKCP